MRATTRPLAGSTRNSGRGAAVGDGTESRSTLTSVGASPTRIRRPARSRGRCGQPRRAAQARRPRRPRRQPALSAAPRTAIERVTRAERGSTAEDRLALDARHPDGALADRDAVAGAGQRDRDRGAPSGRRCAPGRRVGRPPRRRPAPTATPLNRPPRGSPCSRRAARKAARGQPGRGRRRSPGRRRRRPPGRRGWWPWRAQARSGAGDQDRRGCAPRWRCSWRCRSRRRRRGRLDVVRRRQVDLAQDPVGGRHADLHRSAAGGRAGGQRENSCRRPRRARAPQPSCRAAQARREAPTRISSPAPASGRAPGPGSAPSGRSRLRRCHPRRRRLRCRATDVERWRSRSASCSCPPPSIHAVDVDTHRAPLLVATT